MALSLIVLGNVRFHLVLREHPVIIVFNNNFRRDLDLGVLGVELLLNLFGVEFRLHKLLRSELLLILRDFFFPFLLCLQLLPLGKFIDGLLVGRKPCVVGFLECSLTSDVSLLLLVNSLVTVLPVALGDGLAADDVLLAESDSRVQPLEQASKSGVVRVNFLWSDFTDDLVHIVQCLVAKEIVLFLAKNYVLIHTV